MTSIDNGLKLLVQPPGGWTYDQHVDGGTSFKIEGGTYQQLEDKLFQFRLGNIEIIPSGTATRESVRDDIRSEICSRAPNQCVGTPAKELVRQVEEPLGRAMGYTLPISRLDDWFKRLAVENLTWRDPVSARANADICVTCPQNIAWQTGCKPCVETIERRIVRYKGDRSTPVDSQLKACRVFGHHNQLAVFLKNTFSTSKETPPAACWNA